MTGGGFESVPVRGTPCTAKPISISISISWFLKNEFFVFISFLDGFLMEYIMTIRFLNITRYCQVSSHGQALFTDRLPFLYNDAHLWYVEANVYVFGDSDGAVVVL